MYITHAATDEGITYWHWLKREATTMSVDLRLIDHMIGEERSRINSHKVYTLWDAYPHADLVTYPSLYEGFGNALLEAIYFKKLVVVNRYPVYNADIEPKGFEFIELDGYVNDELIEKTRALLAEPDEVKRIVDKNYEIARENYSLETLERKLQAILSNL